MEHSKLIPLLQSLDKEEFKLFGRFVKSKIYNPNKNLIKLYEELKKYYPAFKPKNIEQEKIYGRIFPGKPFHIGIMRNLVSDMMQLVKDFFVYSEASKDTFRQKMYLLSELNKKDLKKFFEKEYHFALNDYKKEKIFDEKTELDMYYIYSIRAKYLKKNLPAGKANQYYDITCRKVDNLVYFFIVTALKDYFNIISGKKIEQFEENLTLKKEVFSHLESNKEKYFKNELIDILYHFIKLKEKDTNDELYRTVKKKIYDSEKKLSKGDLKNLFFELGNYCKYRVAQGEKEFVNELFELEKEMLNSGLYYDEQGWLSVHNYNNIAVSAYNAKNFDWAEKFLYDYKDKLRKTERNNAYNYNLAGKFYSQGYISSDVGERNYLYETALHLLTMIKIQDFYYETKVKDYQIKIYFEMDEMQRTTFLLDTLKHFLKKNKVMPKELKERYKNFANYVYQLMKLRSGSDKMSFDDFRTSVNETQNLENRDWLIRQSEKIEKEGPQPKKDYAPSIA